VLRITASVGQSSMYSSVMMNVLERTPGVAGVQSCEGFAIGM
jgi:hypothetical protein